MPGSSVDVDMGALPSDVNGYVLYMQGPNDDDFKAVYAGPNETIEIGPPPPSSVSVDIASGSDGKTEGHYIYAVQGYSGTPGEEHYTQYSYVEVDVAQGDVVTLTMPTFATDVDGYVVSLYDPTLETYTLIGTTSSRYFLDNGAYDEETPYEPPPAPTIPDFLLNPPTVNGTGTSVAYTVPVNLTIADFAKPTLDKYGRPVKWQELSDTNNNTPIGRLRLIVGGKDVTFFRGVQTIIHGWTDNEPFGDASASIEFPQITTFERFGYGDLAWLTPWAEVTLQLLLAPGVTYNYASAGGTFDYNHPITLFEGLVPSFEDHQSDSEVSLTLSAVGILYQLDYYIKPPSFNDDPVDIGVRIANAINERAVHYGFRGTQCAPFHFGIYSRSGGAWNSLLSGFIQDLLSVCQTEDGHTATLTLKRPRTPFLRWKDRVTIHYAVQNGQPGVEINLTRDSSMNANVIYGEGTDEQGHRWRNTKYPNLHPDTAPLYPPPANVTFSPGGSKSGFNPFADRMRTDGYRMYSGDHYDSRDVDEVRDAQRRAGILVDGIVGPQTWAAVFHVGSNEGSLSGSFFFPLAANPRVQPYLYNTRGGIIGKNPKFNATSVRIEKYENFGDRTTKAEAYRSANAEIHRNTGYVGQITLKADSSNYGSRLTLRAGQNIRVVGYHGQDVLLHIAQVDRDLSGDIPTVTLTVDSQARDLMTISAILERNRETANPSNRQTVTHRSTSNVVDNLVVWDYEAGAGIIPKHAQYAHLWTVMKMPAGERGNIVRTYVHTANSASEFAIAIFSKPVTDVQLRSLLGNPLVNTSDGQNPWDKHAEALDNMGYMYAAGGPDSPGGYWPQTKSGTTNPITGVMRDDAGWYYESDVPPWIWVAIYTNSSCYVDGRLYPGVSDY